MTTGIEAATGLEERGDPPASTNTRATPEPDHRRATPKYTGTGKQKQTAATTTLNSERNDTSEHNSKCVRPPTATEQSNQSKTTGGSCQVQQTGRDKQAGKQGARKNRG